jgi:hypothetical protein
VAQRKMCAQCTFQVCREEAIAAGSPSSAPSFEACQQEIYNQKAKRTNDRIEGYAQAIKDVSELQNAERNAGIFHHNEGETKMQRWQNSIKRLFGEHLISCCAKGELFTMFTNFVARMATVRAIYETAEAIREEGASDDAQNLAFDDAEGVRGHL